jgi:hypothetical protein
MATAAEEDYSQMSKLEKVYDPGNTFSFFVDDVCSLITVGNVVHLAFSAREPSVGDGGEINRVVQVRLIVPNNCLQHIGRVIARGASVKNDRDEIYGLVESPLN